MRRQLAAVSQSKRTAFPVCENAAGSRLEGRLAVELSAGTSNLSIELPGAAEASKEVSPFKHGEPSSCVLYTR